MIRIDFHVAYLANSLASSSCITRPQEHNVTSVYDVAPGAELAQPLAHDGCGADDEGGPEAAAVVEASQKRCQLDSLAQPHLVANYAANTLRVQLPEPLDACSQWNLMRLKRPMLCPLPKPLA